MRRHFTLIFLVLLLLGVGVWSFLYRPWETSGLFSKKAKDEVVIDRFDRVLDEYVSLNSYTALNRLNTQYPLQTKLLIEDVLEIGRVNEPDVEQRLRYFYLDSTVQVILDEVHRQYADMSDIENSFQQVFEYLKKRDPEFRVPHIYTQISCLKQSVVVGDTLIGISLDKYLGTNFPLYQEYYSAEQRAQMTRYNIVTDAISAYLQYCQP